jgi:hypothetical protein
MPKKKNASSLISELKRKNQEENTLHKKKSELLLMDSVVKQPLLSYVVKKE